MWRAMARQAYLVQHSELRKVTPLKPCDLQRMMIRSRSIAPEATQERLS
jgi:hypothetical protein